MINKTSAKTITTKLALVAGAASFVFSGSAAMAGVPKVAPCPEVGSWFIGAVVLAAFGIEVLRRKLVRKPSDVKA